MDKSLIDKIVDKVRAELYSELTVEEEAPTNVIGDGEGSIKLRPTIMRLDGRKKNVRSFIKKIEKDREKREKKKLLKKYPHLN